MNNGTVRRQESEHFRELNGHHLDVEKYETPARALAQIHFKLAKQLARRAAEHPTLVHVEGVAQPLQAHHCQEVTWTIVAGAGGVRDHTTAAVWSLSLSCPFVSLDRPNWYLQARDDVLAEQIHLISGIPSRGVQNREADFHFTRFPFP